MPQTENLRRAALITGGAKGIGRAICLALAENGMNIAVNYAGSAAAAEETAAACRALGVQAVTLQADVRSPEACQKLVEDTVAAFGRIDVLVNNAGITADKLLLRMTEADFDNVLATNLKGAFFCTKAACRFMMHQRYGRIISVSSVVGLHGNAGQANYAASKAGLIGLTKSAAKEYAARNITANVVAPGFIATDMTAVLSEPARAAAEAASRRYIALCAHPVTGLSPEYAAYDGTPVLMFGKNYAYYSDAYRVIMNIALDTLWNGRTQALCDIATHVQDFFAKELPEENYRAYDLDGTRWDEPAMHPVAITAVNAAGSIASDSETADMWLKRWREAESALLCWWMTIRSASRTSTDRSSRRERQLDSIRRKSCATGSWISIRMPRSRSESAFISRKMRMSSTLRNIPMWSMRWTR